MFGKSLSKGNGRKSRGNPAAFDGGAGSLHGLFKGKFPFGNEVVPRKVISSNTEARRQEQERTKTLNRPDREDRVRFALRVCGMVAGTLAAVFIIINVKDIPVVRRAINEIAYAVAAPTHTTSQRRERDSLNPAMPETTATPVLPLDEKIVADKSPPLLGETLENAKIIAQNWRFTLKVGKPQYFGEDCAEGTVCKQEPNEGEVALNHRVTVFLNAPPPTPTPDPNDKASELYETFLRLSANDSAKFQEAGEVKENIVIVLGSNK